MMFAPDIFRDCFLGQALSGGRAAAQYPMELARRAQCHQPVSRGSAWIRSLFAAMPRLSAGLKYDGVLGPLLDAILSPQERPAARPAARRAPARPMPAPSGGHFPGAAHSHGGARNPAGSTDLTAGSRASRVPAAARATWGKTASGSPVSRMASKDLPGHRGIEQADLVRLAQSSGGRGAATNVTRKSKLPPANSHVYRRESGTAAANVVAESMLPASPSLGAAASGLPTPAAIRDWQSCMVERMRGRLRSSFGGYGAVAAASDAMQDVWGLAIDRPAASPERLLPDAGLCAASADSVVHHTDVSSIAETFIAPAAPALAAATGPAERELVAKVGRPAVLANAVASPEGAALAALQVLGEELLSKTNDDLWMPLLIPSRRPGEAPCASSPASLAKTEIPPLGQDMDLGEDLTTLSLKMRRVLNEEARRHGIDV